MRRPIHIQGDHALVKQLTRRQQRLLFPGRRNTIVARIVKTRPNRRAHIPATYSTAMTLAHLLFPKNFPNVIATGRRKKAKEPHSRVTFSKRVNLDKESQHKINCYYSYSDAPEPLYNAWQEIKIDRLTRELTQAGIFPNDLRMNVGIKNKNPVFFEVGSIDLHYLNRYIQSLPEKTSAQRLRKRTAIELLDALKPHAESNGTVLTH